MASRTLSTVISLKNKTTAQWASDTDVQTKGSPCIEFTTDGKTKLKVGDGVNTFADLPYVADELTLTTIVAALGYTPLDEAKVGVANGVAPLDTNGLISADYLPSYVDDCIEVDGIDNAPTTGEGGKIYVDTLTNKCYRWSGTMYVEISTSDVVTASENNGYIKVNGTDVKVFEQTQANWNETDETSPAYIANKPSIPEGSVVDSAFSLTSTNAVQNKVVTAAMNDKIDVNDTLILNCN